MVLAKIAAPAIALGLLVGETAGGSTLLTVAPLLLSGGLLGALGVLLTVRSRNASAYATADEARAEAAGDWQTVYRKSIDDLNDKVESQDRELARQDREMARLRDELRDTIVAQQRAEKELAESRLAYSELDARSGRERHALRDDLAALAVENTNLRHALDAANERIETLEARAGMIERRAGERRDDADDAARSRLSVLEDRANRSDTRAGHTEQRDDDTPGHA